MRPRRPLVLVRHAMPVVANRVSSRDWGLSEEGRREADALASRIKLPEDALLVSSDEVRARQTAEAFSEEFVVDRRLREVNRPWVEDGYENIARRWLTGEDVEGWESRSDVVKRMIEAVDDGFGRSGSTLCVVSHGLAISVLVADLTNDDPVDFWSQLGLPESVSIDYPT